MQPIKLEVRGVSISAFKNKKRAILDRHTGKMRTMTDAKTQKQMELIIRSIKSQLLSIIATDTKGTSTGQRVQSWIASNWPLKDSRQWIPQLYVEAVDCDKGEEGATILIEKL